MTNEAERMARAGNYVMGLMNEAERERAEKDLERDASFRDAVLRIAERMRIVESAPRDATQRLKWERVLRGITDLPQMRGKLPEAGSTAPEAAAAGLTAPARRRMPGRLALAIGAGLVAAFAMGYGVGHSTRSLPAPPAMAQGPAR